MNERCLQYVGYVADAIRELPREKRGYPFDFKPDMNIVGPASLAMMEYCFSEEVKEEHFLSLLFHTMLQFSVARLPSDLDPAIAGQVVVMTFPGVNDEIENIESMSEKDKLLKLYWWTWWMMIGDVQALQYKEHVAKLLAAVEKSNQRPPGRLNIVHSARQMIFEGSPRHGVFVGSFDPPTNAHMWLIREALRTFDTVTVLIDGEHGGKRLMSLERRRTLLEECIGEETRVTVEVLSAEDYVMTHARHIGATHFWRGLPVDRLAHELQDQVNHGHLGTLFRSEIHTIGVFVPHELQHVRSSMVRHVLGGKKPKKLWKELVANYVPEPVLRQLEVIQNTK